MPHRLFSNWQNYFPLEIFALTLAIVGLISFGLVLKQSADLRRQALTGQAVPMLVEFKLDPQTKAISIGRSQRINHLPPTTPVQKPVFTSSLTQSLNHQSVSVNQLKFFDTLQGENFETLLKQPSTKAVDPQIKLDTPIAIAPILYYPGASLNLSTSGLAPQSLSTENLATTLATPVSAPTADSPAPTGLNLLFISNDYPDPGLFNQDADTMFNFLLTVTPFSRYPGQIHHQNLFNTQDLHCVRPQSIPRALNCDLYLTFLVASNFAYNSIIVIDNSTDYGGSAYMGSNIAFTYRDVNALAKQVMVHEFGHSFGSLQDEYSYGVTYADGAPVPWANCDWSPCSKWSGVDQTGCYQSCAYDNLSRPTYNDSLMRSLFPDHGFQFGPVSETHLTEVLATYIGSPLTSDYDHDGDVDYLDLLAYLRSSVSQINLFGFNHLLQSFAH